MLNEKNSCASGPVQLKSMSFKGQLYFVPSMQIGSWTVTQNLLCQRFEQTASLNAYKILHVVNQPKVNFV